MTTQQKIDLFLDIEDTMTEMMKAVLGANHDSDTYKVVEDMIYDVLYSYDELSGAWSMCNTDMVTPQNIITGELYSKGGFKYQDQEYLIRVEVIQTWEDGNYNGPKIQVLFEEIDNDELEEFDISNEVKVILEMLKQDFISIIENTFEIGDVSQEEDSITYRTITLNPEPTDEFFEIEEDSAPKLEEKIVWPFPSGTDKIKEMPQSLANSLKY